jgi:hypothetical protein
MAAVSLQLSAKYLEVFYATVNDVSHLMQCPFSYDEFIEMERLALQDFLNWDIS